MYTASSGWLVSWLFGWLVG